MATTFLTGVVTDKGREIFAKSFGQIGGYSLTWAHKFKFGEGGFQVFGGGLIPKAPNPALLDVEAAADPSLFEFEKVLNPADFQFIAPSTIQIRCRLEPTESNDDGNGEDPRFWEIGIFDINDNMMVYGTFGEQSKNATKTITTFVQVYF